MADDLQRWFWYHVLIICRRTNPVSSCGKIFFGMKRLSFVLIAAALVWMAAGDVVQDIDYRPKLLLKILKKHGVPAFDYLHPMPIPHHGPTPGKFFEVLYPEAAIRYVYVGRVNSCRTGGCSQPDAPTAEELEHEYFDYFILFDAQAQVRAIRVYNYAATYGYEITAPGWLRQFVGYDGSRELLVGKDVDGITGATVSVYAVTADVEARTRQLKEWLATPRQPSVDSSANSGGKVH